jgi:small neutral amino acid transporter SnatA (MarC family)
LGERRHETGVHIVHQHVHDARAVAHQSCIYAVLLMLFFLLFGTLILRLFGVPLSMVRIVGGIIIASTA